MFYVAQSDPPDKSRFASDFSLRNLVVDKKQTPLPNIDELFEQVAGCLVWSKRNLEDGYFYITVDKSLEKHNSIQTTCSKIKSKVILQEECNGPHTIM